MKLRWVPEAKLGQIKSIFINTVVQELSIHTNVTPSNVMNNEAAPHAVDDFLIFEDAEQVVVTFGSQEVTLKQECLEQCSPELFSNQQCCLLQT